MPKTDKDRGFAYKWGRGGNEIASIGINDVGTTEWYAPFFQPKTSFRKDESKIFNVRQLDDMNDDELKECINSVLSMPNVAKIFELIEDPAAHSCALLKTVAIADFQDVLATQLDKCLRELTFGDMCMEAGSMRLRKEVHKMHHEPPKEAAQAKKRSKKACEKPATLPPLSVGARVSIFWPAEKARYEAKVLQVKYQNGVWIFRAYYDDGQEDWRSTTADDWHFVESPPESEQPKAGSSKAHALEKRNGGPSNAPTSKKAKPVSDEADVQPTKFCLKNGIQCAKLPQWSRFCATCGHQQF